MSNEKPSDRLTEEDVNNVKRSGSGFVHFLLAVLWSVLLSAWITQWIVKTLCECK